MVKADKNRIHETLGMVIELCGRLPEFSEGEVRTEILTNVQEAIIAIGEALENNQNAIDKKEIENEEMIHRLEDICEKIFVCSNDVDTTKTVELVDAVKEVDNMIMLMPRTFRVAFLPYNASMWDSLESIWIEFAKDERCETTVVPIPYYNLDPTNQKMIPKYEGNMYPDYVPVVSFEIYDLEEKHPDIIFVHNPYDDCNRVTTIFPQFYSKELKKYCEKLVYVPYFVNPGYIGQTMAALPVLNNADYIIGQAEYSKSSVMGTNLYTKVLPLGSPIFDKVLKFNKHGKTLPDEWKQVCAGKKLVLLNTTIDELLTYNEKVLKKLKELFECVHEIDDVAMIWRPHPLLESTMVSMRPGMLDEYLEIKKYFVENGIGILDTSTDVAKSVANCDAYMGSNFSSIIALFQVCGKPILTSSYDITYEREKPKVYDGDPVVFFTDETNEPYFDAEECVEYDFRNFVDDLLMDRFEVVRIKELKAAKITIINFEGNCGVDTHNYIMGEVEK